MKTLTAFLTAIGFAAAAIAAVPTSDAWLTLTGGDGPGHGKHVVLVSGDEEYRSEEMLPQLAKILAKRHGFKCTVLFAIDPKDGTINPNYTENIPGLEALDSADLMVVFTRFRKLPDEQMKHIVDYVEAGKPVIGLRTATHAFDPKPDSKYAKWKWNSKEWDGGFGRQVLGETWINHHGNHGKTSTRGIIAGGQQSHPILRGIKDGDVWGPTDVYGVRLPMSAECTPLLLGQTLTGMKPTDPPAPGKVNDPMMPVAWTKMYKSGRTFTSTLAAAQDFETEGLRRLLVNACYWCVGLDDRITDHTNVDLVGEYHPLPFKGNGFKKGVKPNDLVEK